MKIRSHTFRQSFMATPPEGSWIQKLSQKKCSVLVLVLQMGRGYFLWRSSCPPSRYLLFFHAWQLRYVSSQLRIRRAYGRRTSDLLFSQRLSTIVLANLPSYCRWPIWHLCFGLEQSREKNWRCRCYKSCVRAWSCKYHLRKLDEKHLRWLP